MPTKELRLYTDFENFILRRRELRDSGVFDIKIASATTGSPSFNRMTLRLMEEGYVLDSVCQTEKNSRAMLYRVVEEDKHGKL